MRWLRYRLLVGLDVAQHWRWWPFRFSLRLCYAAEREYARRAERDQ